MKTNWNFTHLIYFRDAVKMGSVKLAAQKHNVTHSTISQAILKLEHSFETKLTTREKRRFQPTHDGMYIYQMSHSLFKSYTEFQTQIESDYREPSGSFIFASSQSILSNLILPCFPIIEKKFPKIKIGFEIGRTQEIKNFVKKGVVELGITLSDEKLEGMEQIHLKTGKYILVTSKSNKNWKNSGFILTKPRPETIKLESEFKAREKEIFNIRWVVDSWALASEMASTAGGVALIPDFAFDKLSNLKKINWDCNAQYDLVLFHRKNEALSAQANYFLEEFVKVSKLDLTIS